eukprot:427156_1
MSDITINTIQQLSKSDRNTGVKLLLKIIHNIIKNPTNSKFCNLNLQRITKRFSKSDVFLQLMYDTGFYKSNNGFRLIFDIQRLNELKLLHNKLSQLMSNNVTEPRSSVTKQTERKQPTNNKDSKISNCTQSLKNTLELMGFPSDMARLALTMANNDINVAVEYLIDEAAHNSNHKNTDVSQSSCSQNVKNCKAVLNLCHIMHTYYHNAQNDACALDTIDTLDTFHHLLLFHNDDDAFEYIYHSFNRECDPNKCDSVRRYYRPQNSNTEIHCKQFEPTLELLDKIHCHFCHQYDIGARLTAMQRMKFCEGLNLNIVNILREKLKLFNKITHLQRFMGKNKFCSNLSQMKTLNIISSECKDNTNMSAKSLIPLYSFSFPFNYWNIKDPIATTTYFNLKYEDMYIAPKYETLKDELFSNTIATIAKYSFDEKMKQVKNMIKTQLAKTYMATTNDYRTCAKYKMDHPSRFGYKDGYPISISHLLVIVIYCGFDEFQRKFSETYRALHKDDNLQTIKTRHANFHHFGKHIRECVDVFGTKYCCGTMTRVYHGISQEMVFNSIYPRINGVLSTTCQRNVGLQFSNNSGICLEMIPSHQLKYFRCDWLSPFSNEAELLFVGGLQPMNFMNILFIQSGNDWKIYIYALRIIETMTSGNMFMDNPADFHKIIQRKTRSVELLGLKATPFLIQKLCVALICHELNRNGMDANKYPKFPDLHPYVDTLVHQLCSHRQGIVINWKSMNVDILEGYDIDSLGYIGYKFMKSMFCTTKYEGIFLDMFSGLFPNLKHVYLCQLTKIDSRFLDDILEYLQYQKTGKLMYLELATTSELGMSNIIEQCNKYLDQFWNIGFWSSFVLHPDSSIPTMMIGRIGYGVFDNELNIEMLRQYHHKLIKAHNVGDVEYIQNLYNNVQY